MRDVVDNAKLLRFMTELGARSTGPGKVYIAGGSSALLLGIRPQTIDIDLKLSPEPPAAFEAIAKLKETLSLNVELASPDDFMPAIPGWEDRSEFIIRSGEVDFFHYDFYSQVLAKVLRGHRTDISDARAFVALGKVDVGTLKTLFEQIRDKLIRFPRIDPVDFEEKLTTFLQTVDSDGA